MRLETLSRQLQGINPVCFSKIAHADLVQRISSKNKLFLRAGTCKLVRNKCKPPLAAIMDSRCHLFDLFVGRTSITAVPLQTCKYVKKHQHSLALPIKLTGQPNDVVTTYDNFYKSGLNGSSRSANRACKWSLPSTSNSHPDWLASETSTTRF